MERPPNPPEPHMRVQPPVVYVEPTWEYKHLARDLLTEPAPDEPELNELGAQGWELAAAVVHGGDLHLYFKREKS